MKEISAALVKAQKEFGPALKTATNPQFRSQYANLSSCIEAVIDGLNNNGIYLMQTNEERVGGICVNTVFIHESGEQISSGPFFVPAAKQDPQGFGSALTYARRYSLMAACGIAPEDDDANSATAAFNKAPAAPKPVPKAVVEPAPVAKPVVEHKPAVAAPQAPAKIEGSANQWQLKVTTEPGTDFKQWVEVVNEAAKFMLEMAQNTEDTMTIFRTNRNIFDRIQADDKPSYDALMAIFKTYKEKLNVKVS